MVQCASGEKGRSAVQRAEGVTLTSSAEPVCCHGLMSEGARAVLEAAAAWAASSPTQLEPRSAALRVRKLCVGLSGMTRRACSDTGVPSAEYERARTRCRADERATATGVGAAAGSPPRWRKLLSGLTGARGLSGASG